MKCEICKSELPKCFKINDNLCELIMVERPQMPYIILEKLLTQNNVDDTSISVLIPGDMD